MVSFEEKIGMTVKIRFSESQANISQKHFIETFHRTRGSILEVKCCRLLSLLLQITKRHFELIENTAASFEGILAQNSDGRQTSSEVNSRSGGVSTWKADHLQTEAVVLIFILSQIFFQPLPSFFASVKTQEKIASLNTILDTPLQL